MAAHEGGDTESAVPFRGLVIIETLSGIRTDVVDPFEESFVAQHPTARVFDYQRAIHEIGQKLHLYSRTRARAVAAARWTSLTS